MFFFCHPQKSKAELPQCCVFVLPILSDILTGTSSILTFPLQNCIYRKRKQLILTPVCWSCSGASAFEAEFWMGWSRQSGLLFSWKSDFFFFFVKMAGYNVWMAMQEHHSKCKPCLPLPQLVFRCPDCSEV